MDVREKEQKKTVKYKEQEQEKEKEQAIENGSPLFFVLHAGRSGTLDSPFANKADSLAYFHLLGQFSAFKAESPLYFSKNQLLPNLKRRTDSISLKTVYFPHLRRIIRFGAWLLGYCYSQNLLSPKC